MQASGDDPNRAKLGQNIFKIGIVLQSISYYVFMGLLAYTHWHVKQENLASPRATWWNTVWVLYTSSIFIVVSAKCDLRPMGCLWNRHDRFVLFIAWRRLLVPKAITWWHMKVRF
jgi:hypothetical protein